MYKSNSDIGSGGCGLVLFGILFAAAGLLAVVVVFGPSVSNILTLVP